MTTATPARIVVATCGTCADHDHNHQICTLTGKRAFSNRTACPLRTAECSACGGRRQHKQCNGLGCADCANETPPGTCPRCHGTGIEPKEE